MNLYKKIQVKYVKVYFAKWTTIITILQKETSKFYITEFIR